MKLIAEYNDLKAIADSIREKTSTTDEMNIYEMPSLIEGIKTGENLENELTTQDNLITQIQTALEGKANLELPPLTNPASAEKVLNGYEYVNTDGTKSVGTMTNRGAVSQTLAANGSYTIPAGYHNGSGKVTQSLTTKTAATYGAKTSDQTISSGQYLSGAQIIKKVEQSGLSAENIVKGKTVTIKSNGSNLWNITGTAEPSDLNFKIVGGTTQPTNPIENTIWINTSLNITGWTFDTEAPSYLSAGGVWIKTSTAGNAKLNLLKQNTVFISFLYAFQWDGATFVPKEIKMYQNGNWIVPGMIFYHNGAQIVPWEIKRNANGEANFTDSYISLRATSTNYDRGITIGTVNKINFDSIDSITFNATTIQRSAASNFTTSFIIDDNLSSYRPNLNEWNPIARLVVSTANTKKDFTINTSNITGNHYIGIGIDTGMSGSLDPIYLYSCTGK